MWYIFLSFIPSERAQKYLQKPPSFTIFISPVDDLKNNKDLLLELHNSLKKCHKLNLISLLIEYFKCMSDKINEFKYIVLDFVATAKEDEVNEEEVIEKDGEQQTVKLELYLRLFEIAKYIDADKDVINKALEVMRLCDDTSSLKFQYCIQYLSICYDVLELDQINEIVERSLNEKSRQFTITSILNLVSFVIEDDECFIKQFKRKTIAKVIKLWRKFSKVHINNQAPETQNSFLLLDSILTIGRIIYNSEVNNIIQKYIGKERKKQKKKEENDDLNLNAELQNEISNVGNDWENWNEIKDQIINWSRKDYLELKKGAKQEEREKNIVIQFNE